MFLTVSGARAKSGGKARGTALTSSGRATASASRLPRLTAGRLSLVAPSTGTTWPGPPGSRSAPTWAAGGKPAVPRAGAERARRAGRSRAYVGGAAVVRRVTSVGERLTWTEGLPRFAMRSRSRRAAFRPISLPAWSTLVREIGPSAAKVVLS